MNGLLVVDKPVGPTSHDVVARLRRALGERRAGHTGTLDPGASGVLPVVLGRATRLARFLSGQDKTYLAAIRLGIETDTWDSTGAVVDAARAGGPWPARDSIEQALGVFRGTFLQQPPAYSAKKIGGERSYRLARRASSSPPAPPALPAPVAVSVRRLEIVEVADSLITLRIECSAGFYVRSLAHEVGRALGTGAHMAALRREASGAITLNEAIALDVLEADPDAAKSAIVPVSRMLPDLPACRLTRDGVRRAVHGQDVRPVDCEKPPANPGARFVRLIGADDDLVAVGEASGAGGVLHPLVVMV
jgi:tRNA pseudouridine55 synthase